MANSMWNNLISHLGVVGYHPVKRRVQAHPWRMASEQLEDRALLSAASPVAAEVAVPRKVGLAHPDVSGNWDLTLDNNETSTATAFLNTNGPDVESTFTIPGLPEIDSSDKFSKKLQLQYSGKVKINDPELGKLTVTFTVVVPEAQNEPNPLHPHFITGTVHVTGKNLPNPIDHTFTGELQTGQGFASPGAIAKATTYPSIGGVWTLTGTSSLGPVTGDLNIHQDPPTSRKFSADFSSSIATLTLKGKFDAADTTKALGKAVLKPTDGGTVKAKFNITFANDFTTFTGSAVSKHFPTIQLEGVRQGT